MSGLSPQELLIILWLPTTPSKSNFESREWLKRTPVRKSCSTLVLELRWSGLVFLSVCQYAMLHDNVSVFVGQLSAIGFSRCTHWLTPCGVNPTPRISRKLYQPWAWINNSSTGALLGFRLEERNKAYSLNIWQVW